MEKLGIRYTYDYDVSFADRAYADRAVGRAEQAFREHRYVRAEALALEAPVQEAAIAALRDWAAHGLPDHPRAWLT